MYIFNIVLSDLTIEIHSRFDYLRQYCLDYLSEGKTPDFFVYVGDEKLKELRDCNPDICDEFLERDAVYSEIASRLPHYERAVIHGACISYKNKAYLFTAPSGTGKTTHISLWKKYLGDSVTVINGDKPIFYAPEKGVVRAFGTPWCGKEGWHRNESAEIAGICFIERGKKNRIRSFKPEEAVSPILRQMFYPDDHEGVAKTLGLADRLVSTVPVYILECDISGEAFRTSFKAMTGERYVDISTIFPFRHA